MRKAFRSVNTRMIALILLFVLLITAVVVVFSFDMMTTFRTGTALRTTAFGLQLIASAIERDLVELVALANWCSFATNPIPRYLDGAYSAPAAVRAFLRLQEEVRNSRARTYVDRIIISDTDAEKVLHTGTNTTFIRSFDREGLSVLDAWPLTGGAAMYDITVDPFSRTGSQVLNILAPVQSPINYSVIGRVYLAASVSVFTDKLRGYDLPSGAALVLSIGDNHYRIAEGRRVEPADPPAGQAARPVEGWDTQGADALRIAGADGRQTSAVSCQVRDGITITQVFADGAFAPVQSEWTGMLTGIVLLIILLALAIIAMLHAMITRPLGRIRGKVDAIAAGDFASDPSIESDSEIGEVGRGINHLSQSVTRLMDSRLSDEKQKRELEYRMLQSQINPHFLYNTLGAIKWMATLQKATGIAEMTTALSRLLQTVAKDARTVVPLREELALLDDYFLILKYRYGAAVAFDREIQEDTLLDTMLPRFVLQPLMENAIFHGIEPKGAGRVALCVARVGGDVLISLQDDGVGMDAARTRDILTEGGTPPGGTAQPRGTRASMGLRSVYARIRNVFGPPYGLHIESTPGKGTRMTLRMPVTFADADTGEGRPEDG